MVPPQEPGSEQESGPLSRAPEIAAKVPSLAVLLEPLPGEPLVPATNGATIAVPVTDRRPTDTDTDTGTDQAMDRLRGMAIVTEAVCSPLKNFCLVFVPQEKPFADLLREAFLFH